MNTRVRLWWGTLATLLIISTSCAAAPTEEPLDITTVPSTDLLIVTSTSLLADVVGELIGDTARVETLIEDGEDPRSAELSSRAKLLLDPNRTLLAVTVGGEFEGFSATIQSAADDGLNVFEISALADAAPVEGEGDDHHVDPHVWTDPSAMAPAVRRLGDRLSELDPIFADPETRKRADLYADGLLTLDQEFANDFDELTDEQRRVVMGEDVLGRFAARYGIDVVGFAREDGVATHDLVELSTLRAALGREASTRDVFFPVTTNDVEGMELVEEALGVPVRVAVIDTAEPSSPAGTYLGLLRTLVEEFLTHLKRG